MGEQILCPNREKKEFEIPKLKLKEHCYIFEGVDVVSALTLWRGAFLQDCGEMGKGKRKRTVGPASIPIFGISPPHSVTSDKEGRVCAFI